MGKRPGPGPGLSRVLSLLGTQSPCRREPQANTHGRLGARRRERLVKVGPSSHQGGCWPCAVTGL